MVAHDAVVFEIDGAAVRDIPSFYDELNRLFMTGEDWRLGASLDALDDLLYGGYGALHGALHGAERARIVWRDHAVSRAALGRETTAAYYEEKLRHPESFNAARFREKLAELDAGRGETYFELVLDVFAGHPEIDLVLA